MDKVACRTPAEGRDGVTNIPAWKFDAVHKAIHAALANGPLYFKDLAQAAKAHMDDATVDSLGSLGWHVTTVKLELEVRGEIARVSGVSPQQIERAETA